MRVEPFVEGVFLGRYREFIENLCLHLLFFRCLQLKTINMPSGNVGLAGSAALYLKYPTVKTGIFEGPLEMKHI